MATGCTYCRRVLSCWNGNRSGQLDTKGWRNMVGQSACLSCCSAVLFPDTVKTSTVTVNSLKSPSASFPINTASLVVISFPHISCPTRAIPSGNSHQGDGCRHAELFDRAQLFEVSVSCGGLSTCSCSMFRHCSFPSNHTFEV